MKIRNVGLNQLLMVLLDALAIGVYFSTQHCIQYLFYFLYHSAISIPMSGFTDVFYVFTALSLLYIIGLFLYVLIKKTDVSCRKILWIFLLIVLSTSVIAIINSFLPTLFVVGKAFEDLLSWMSIVVSFIPSVGCLLFLTGLILYSIYIAKSYAGKANAQFVEINRQAARLDEFNKLLCGDVTLTDF